MSRVVEIEYKVVTRVCLSDAGEADLLEAYAEAVEAPDGAPVGMVAAVSKLTAESPTEQVLETVIGEVSARVLAQSLPPQFPSGAVCEVRRVEYRTPPPKIDPPETAIPKVANIGDRHQP